MVKVKIVSYIAKFMTSDFMRVGANIGFNAYVQIVQIRPGQI